MHRTVAAILPLLLLPMTALSETAQDVMQSLIGQPLLLAHVARVGKIKLKASHLNKIAGSCDMATLVTAAEWQAGTARIRLRYIGIPVLPNGVSHGCPTHDESVLEFTGFATDESGSSVAAAIHHVLQTPEQFLADRGIRSDFPPAPEDEKAVRLSPSMLAPVPLLRVDASYTDTARQKRVNGAVLLRLVVGTDGRAHRVQVLRSLGSGLDENALQVMPLWRFQPGFQGEQPVAVLTHIQMSFRLL
jgi:TonB family protein